MLKVLKNQVCSVFAISQENLLQVDNIIFEGFGLAYPKHLGKFAMSL